MPRGEGSSHSSPTGHRPGERDESLTEVCRQAVQRLAALLPGAQVSCHLRVGDALRVLATVDYPAVNTLLHVPRRAGGFKRFRIRPFELSRLSSSILAQRLNLLKRFELLELNHQKIFERSAAIERLEHLEQLELPSLH